MDRDHYDQTATVFSPDGRVYQVEYAREAIKRGGLAVGIRFRDGILFNIDKSIHSPLVEEDDLEKFFRITGTIGAAASGLIADARVLVDILREKAQAEKRRYGEEPDIRTLVEWVSRIYEVYTRYEGVRPFGTAMIIGGQDPSGFHLYETDPSGVFQERKAAAIGKGSRTAMELLEKYQDEGMSREEAIALSLMILKETVQERPADVSRGEEIHILTKDGFERIDLDGDSPKLKEILGASTWLILFEGKGEESLSDLEVFLSGTVGLNRIMVSVIMERFSTMEVLMDADMSDLTSLAGIGPATAGRILKALKELEST